jgi:hypothetical protein
MDNLPASFELYDQLGHLFYAFIFIGTYLVAQKKRIGWVLRFAGEASWCVIGVQMGMSSIWLWGVVFLFNDAFGYYKWRDPENFKT